jgi:hypothetical protein
MGIYRGGTDILKFVTAGTDAITIDASQDVTLAGSLNFANNEKALFGAGSDLQIYHDGGNSRIDDAGSGRLIIRGNGGVSLEKYTGATLAIFNADGASSLYYNNSTKLATTDTGIEVTSTDATISITGTRGTDSTHTISTGGTNSQNLNIASAGDFYRNATNHVFRDQAGTTEFMRIKDGNVGIGAVPSAWTDYKSLDIQGASFAGLAAQGAGVFSNVYYDGSYRYKTSTVPASYFITGSQSHKWYIAPSGTAGNVITFDQAMTLDSSGNLLVGKTSIGTTTEGAEVRNNGHVAAARDLTGSSGSVLYLNRIGTTDGPIQTFYKDDSTVGSIGTIAGNLGIVSGNVGIRFRDTEADIIPIEGDFTSRDNAIDLGDPSYRFKDLYLSGGIQFDSRSNKLDDYEEGTWTPVLAGGITAGTYELSDFSGTYTKIGRLVYVSCTITLDSSITGGGSSYAKISGLPFNYDVSEDKGMTGHVRTTGVNYNSSATQIQVVRESGADSDGVAFLETFSNAAAQFIQISDFSASDTLNFTLTYNTLT